MIKTDLGLPAEKDFKRVRYFPFGNAAADAYILTSEPLGYLEAWLDNKIDEIKRDNSQKRIALEKAQYFTQLSKDFYNSFLSARMPSKGTLLYYSLINLVKVHLIVNGYRLESKVEHHGLSLPPEKETTLKLSKGEASISIFHEFAKTIDKEIDHSRGLNIELSDLLRNIPEVHEIGYALNLFPQTKRKYLPVQVEIRTNKSRSEIFFTIAYDKKFRNIMKVEKLKKNHFKDLLKPFEIDNEYDKIYLKSTKSYSYTQGSERSWKICYPKIVNEISNLNIVPILTKEGFKYYLDLEPYRLHRLSAFLAFSFYLGTVARYRPSLNEKILKGKYQTIINEAIISCPSQFFYLMVSHITNQICTIPQAKID